MSLFNLRLLSPALDGYLAAGFVRGGGAMRLLSPVYVRPAPGQGPPPADGTPPVVTNFSPAPGTPISRTTPLLFDVTEDSGAFRRIFVLAFFSATNVTEVIHDGDDFRGDYPETSSRHTIAGGFRYSVLRAGGWPTAPTLQIFAINQAGREA